jgi:hypothetical protein
MCFLEDRPLAENLKAQSCPKPALEAAVQAQGAALETFQNAGVGFYVC